MQRRRFIATCAAAAAVTPSLAEVSAGQESKNVAVSRPRIISTWPFGVPANDVAMETLKAGGSPLDAVERGIWVTELDSGNASVGLGGTPNAAGVVQLDACIMDGPGHRAGSVAAIEGIQHPISVARRVMEKSRHVMLVGAGARQFAIEQGLAEAELLTESQRAAWEKWKAAQPQGKSPKSGATNHDTIALLVVGDDGNLAGGCSTSGLGYKLPGRVGDSPILGSGLYVDNEVGAAGATGVGENVMRYCGSFMIVEAMHHGMSPQEACEATIRRIAKKDPLDMSDLHINFVALDRKGRVGAAGTDKEFRYSATDAMTSDAYPAKWVQASE